MKQQLRKEIGMRMRQIRKALGYTQVQMVSFFDIGRANYSRIEKGEIFPTSTILNALLKEFHVSLDWLIADEGDMFLPQKRTDIKRDLDFGNCSEEVSDLLFHMEKVPMLRHAVLGFFLEYQQKNHQIIQEILKESSNIHSLDNV